MVPESNVVLEAARAYARRGWKATPIPYGKKRPVQKGWQRLRLDEAQLPRYFDGHAQNIGARLGEPSGGLVEGCLKWQSEGLDPPDEVTAATEQYRSDMDDFDAFTQT